VPRSAEKRGGGQTRNQHWGSKPNRLQREAGGGGRLPAQLSQLACEAPPAPLNQRAASEEARWKGQGAMNKRDGQRAGRQRGRTCGARWSKAARTARMYATEAVPPVGRQQTGTSSAARCAAVACARVWRPHTRMAAVTNPPCPPAGDQARSHWRAAAGAPPGAPGPLWSSHSCCSSSSAAPSGVAAGLSASSSTWMAASRCQSPGCGGGWGVGVVSESRGGVGMHSAGQSREDSKAAVACS
jgi:hypothetical protein